MQTTLLLAGRLPLTSLKLFPLNSKHKVLPMNFLHHCLRSPFLFLPVGALAHIIIRFGHTMFFTGPFWQHLVAGGVYCMNVLNVCCVSVSTCFISHGPYCFVLHGVAVRAPCEPWAPEWQLAAGPYWPPVCDNLIEHKCVSVSKLTLNGWLCDWTICTALIFGIQVRPHYFPRGNPMLHTAGSGEWWK